MAVVGDGRRPVPPRRDARLRRLRAERDLLKQAAADLLGVPHRLTAEDVDADESFIEPGYGLPSERSREALKLLATTEAILTDHVYTAKALAGLIADVRAGKYPPGAVIVFIHTGGVPAIFAEPDKVL